MDIFVESPKYGEGYAFNNSFTVTKKSYNTIISCKIGVRDIQLVHDETILDEIHFFLL